MFSCGTRQRQTHISMVPDTFRYESKPLTKSDIGMAAAASRTRPACGQVGRAGESNQRVVGVVVTDAMQ